MNRFNRSCMINLRNILYDVLGNLTVFLLCHYAFSTFLDRANISFGNTLMACGIYLFIYILLGLAGKMYDMTTFYYKDRVIRHVLIDCMTSTAVVTLVFYFTNRAASNRDFYATYFILCVIAHMIAAFLSFQCNRRQTGAQKTLLVGTKSCFEKLSGYIFKTNLSFDPIGYVKLEREETEDEVSGAYLGFASEGDLEQLIRKMVVDQVYIMSEAHHEKTVQRCLDICVNLGIVTRLVLPLAREDCSTHISCVGTYPVVSYHLNSLDPMMHFVKRTVDVLGACIGIILSSPILLASAIAIKLDSAGPIFFTQTRVGQNGRRFKIIKLRTMTVDAEEHKEELVASNEIGGGLMFKIKEDPRVTHVGAFLRKTSIDEIPQFFNVLAGDMSLVGTRPPTEDEVSRYEDVHWRRLRIKPGITGLWQISGRSAIHSFDEIVALDTEYIKTWTIFTDFKILFKTIAVVLNRKGAY